MASGVVLSEKLHTLGVSLKGCDAFFKEARKSEMMEKKQVIRARETKMKKGEGKETESNTTQQNKRQEEKGLFI